MKNLIFKSLIIISLLVFSISCDDAVDILPVDTVSAEDALTTPEAIDLALSGAYAGYAPQTIISFASRFTDNLKIGVDNGGQGVDDLNQVLNSNSGSSGGIFASYYNVINRVNRILEAIEVIDRGPLTPQQLERLDEIQGQSLALRALSHFDLLTHFATDYTDNSALAIAYIDFVVVLELPGRNTVGEVFDAIETDLQAAAALIENETNIFMTDDLITALRAKIALFRGNNELAAQLSQQLINEYPLANRQQYVDMYFDQDDTEVIFRVARTVTDARIGGLFYFTGTGGAFLEMSVGLFSELNPNDVRFDVLVDDDIDGGAIDPVSNPPGTIFIKKYPGRDGQFGLNDIKMYRVSEQYFINAEALARMGDLEGAAERIDELRDARFNMNQVAPDYGNLQEAIVNILEERRIELAYEGHRFIDIKRTRDITNEGVIRDMADCGGATPCELPVDDFRFTLPIPQGEIDVNPNVEQNPGYATN